MAAGMRVPVNRLGPVGGERLHIRLVGVGATGAAEERGAGVADDAGRPPGATAPRLEAGAAARPRARRAEAPRMCGVVGVLARARRPRALAALALFALQHRGQESAGLAVSDGRGVMVYKDLGLVDQVLDERRLPVAARRPRDRPLPLLDDRAPRSGRTASRRFAWVPRGRSRSATTATWSTRAQLLARAARRPIATGRHDRHRGAHRAAGQRAGRRPRRCPAALLPRVSGAYSLVVMDEARVDRRARPVWLPPAGTGRAAYRRRRGLGASRRRRQRSTSWARSTCATSSRARWSCWATPGGRARSVSPRRASSCACSS